jgi:hypothetical protein
VEQVIGIDAGYILWLSDEKICKVSETVLNYADEAETDQRLTEAMDCEFRGIDMWDFVSD